MERLTTKADVYRAMLEYANTSYRERIPYLCHLHRVVDRGNVDERASDGVLRDIQRLVDALGGAGVLMVPPHIEGAIVGADMTSYCHLAAAYRLGILHQLLSDAETTT